MIEGETGLESRLDGIRAAGLHRELVPISGPGVRVRVRGRAVVSFCTNDYLGLATKAPVLREAKAALDTYGGGSGSSRLIAGDYPLLQGVEERLAAFVGRESALVFGSGYLANLGVLQALPQAGDRILSDALNHASLIDGCRLSRAKVEVLPHNDLDALKGALAQGSGRTFHVTESIFSMDGDAPDLPRQVQALKAAGALSIVDEAHALGVAGEGGRGLTQGLPVDVVVGTFGKAFGSAGAFVAGSHALRELLINQARSFIFTTAPPPAALGAVAGALSILETDATPRQRLQGNITYLHRRLGEAGFDTRPSTSHIIPIIIGPPEGALALSSALFEAGYFLRAIRPPTVPPGTSRLRLTLSADHTQSDLDGLIDALLIHCEALKLGPFKEATP